MRLRFLYYPRLSTQNQFSSFKQFLPDSSDSLLSNFPQLKPTLAAALPPLVIWNSWTPFDYPLEIPLTERCAHELAGAERGTLNVRRLRLQVVCYFVNEWTNLFVPKNHSFMGSKFSIILPEQTTQIHFHSVCIYNILIMQDRHLLCNCHTW